MYVVFENIDVARPNDANYDSISPLCKVDMEVDFYKTTPCKEEYTEMLEQTKWKGYVRLKLRENPNFGKPANQYTEDVYTDGSSGYSTTSGYSSKTKLTIIGENKCGHEEIYDYAYIAHMNTNHPLSELKMNNQREKIHLDAKVLPESCMCCLGQFFEPEHEDTDDEHDEESDDENDDDEDGYCSEDEDETRQKDFSTTQALKFYKMEQERRKRLLQQRYLNSKEIMRYFGELLRQELAPKLYLSEDEIQEGSYRGTSIYTTQYEIIPAIHVPQNAQNWPDCAFQFRIRERPITTNPLTGQNFQWPTRSMIKRIETFGFHIIPIGYAPKRQRNPYRELEWRIVFPKAERYLEQHLTSTQVKVLMMTKALVKTFIEPKEKNKALMFVMDHLRMHLFWECERNFTAWPEEFLGEVLIRFLTSFMQRLRKKLLPDYFIEERNLFESIPEYSLVTLFSILADITANPIMHFMVAFRNLRFPENFFPKLNFRKIYDNLVENDIVKLKNLAKNSRKLTDAEDVDGETFLLVDEGATGLVGMKQHREKVNGRLRRKTQIMRHHIEIKKKLDYELNRKSIESIDVEFFFGSNLHGNELNTINQGLENLRRTNILETLLDHLLDMAEKAVAVRTIHLAKQYLSQATRLCKFYHNFGCDLGAKEYLASIHDIEESISATSNCSTTPPALPIRASVEPVRRAPSRILNDNIESFSGVKDAPSCSNTKSLIKSEIHEAVSHSTENNANTWKCEVQVHREPIMEKESEETKNILTQSPEPRKSIHFLKHVVEVHEGDESPIKKRDCYSPVSILRFGGEISRTEINRSTPEISKHQSITENNIQILATNTNNSNEDKPEMLPSKQTSTAAAFLNKFSSAADILKSTPIGDLNVMKALTTSTEKVMRIVNDEEKRSQIREMFKRKTVQIKGAFNQSSDS